MASEGSRLLEEALKQMAEAIKLKLAEMEPSSGVASASVSAEGTDTAGEVSVHEVESASVAALTWERREANFLKSFYPRWKDDEFRRNIQRAFNSLVWRKDADLTGNIRSAFRDVVRERRYDALGGGTDLHWAVRMEDLELVTRILEAGQVDVNATDGTWKATALHWAARIGNMDIVKAMCTDHFTSGNFNLGIKDKWGYTALEYAIFHGGKPNVAMVIELLNFKDSIHVYDDDVKGVIANVEKIRQEGDSNIEVVEHRFESQRYAWYDKLNPTYLPRTCYFQTYLHWAMIMEDVALVNHILEVGKIHDNVDTVYEMSPLIVAVRLNNLEIVELMVSKHLESNNFDVNFKTWLEGYTALHWAIIDGGEKKIDMVKELLRCESTMRLTEECDCGKSPLQLAHELGFKDIQKVLMEREVVRRYVEDLYRDRQVYVDAANAILVGAALIASVTFASWLQPPLGYTSGYVDVQQNNGLRAFSVFNCLSFYFAIATVVFGARSVLPRSTYFIKVTVEKLRKNLLMTAILLACSVFFVIGAFGIAGCIVLTPILKLQLYMIIPTIFGGLLCLISLGLLSYSMWEDGLGRGLLGREYAAWRSHDESLYTCLYD